MAQDTPLRGTDRRRNEAVSAIHGGASDTGHGLSATGYRSCMYVERTFTVPRPVEAVYDYLSDFTHTTQWDPGTVTCTRTSGDGGVGTVYANTSKFLSRDVELTYTTAVADRPSEVRFDGVHEKATASDHLRFTRAADGTATQIHYRADFHFGRLVSLVAPVLVRPKLEQLADETVEQLEKTLLNLPPG